MQRKFLEDLGLEKDVIDKIMGENGKDIETAKSINAGALQAKITELNTANETIRTLKANAEKFDGIDISELKEAAEKAQEEVKQMKIDAAVQIALVKNKAVDVDYLLFKAKSSEKKVDMDDNGKITGIDGLITELKTSCPAQFEKAGKNVIEENRLPTGDDSGADEPETLAEALKLAYEKTNE